MAEPLYFATFGYNAKGGFHTAVGQFAVAALSQVCFPNAHIGFIHYFVKQFRVVLKFLNAVSCYHFYRRRHKYNIAISTFPVFPGVRKIGYCTEFLFCDFDFSV